MAISINAVWEVESGGSNTNGGGFITGSSGTDYSQQTSAQIAVADAVAVGSTTITSATASFNSTHVGNTIYLAGGTGSLTASWYQVVTVSNSTTIIIDRNVATGTGITLNLGGAFATIQAGVNQLQDGQAVYVKAATYTISAAITIPSLVNSVYYTQIIGYSTVRGDNGMPNVVQTAADFGIHINNPGVLFQNFILDGSSTTGTIGILMDGSFGKVVNVKIKNWLTYGIDSIGQLCSIYGCEVSGTKNGAAIFVGSQAFISNCYLHQNLSDGINLSDNGCPVVNNIIINNGANGIVITDEFAFIDHNLIYGNGGHGITAANIYSYAITTVITNNIIAKNLAWGINAVSTGTAALFTYPYVQYNGFWSNVSGAANNMGLDSTNVLISGITPTNDPFVNDSGGNFALNNTAGAGALLRAAGFAGQFIGLSTSTGFADIGPFQHQATSTSSTLASTFVS